MVREIESIIGVKEYHDIMSLMVKKIMRGENYSDLMTSLIEVIDIIKFGMSDYSQEFRKECRDILNDDRSPLYDYPMGKNPLGGVMRKQSHSMTTKTV
jgi:hypothetical protein